MDIRHLARSVMNRERQRAQCAARLHGRRHQLWSSVEIAFLRRHYPNKAVLQRKLPLRSWTGIKAKALKIGLTRSVRPWTTVGILRLRRVWPVASREEIRRAFPDCPWPRLYHKASELKLRRPTQQRVAAHPLVEEVRKRARSLNYVLADIDMMMGHASYAKNSGRMTNPQINRLLQLIELLDGDLEIIWRN